MMRNTLLSVVAATALSVAATPVQAPLTGYIYYDSTWDIMYGEHFTGFYEFDADAQTDYRRLRDLGLGGESHSGGAPAAGEWWLLRQHGDWLSYWADITRYDTAFTQLANYSLGTKVNESLVVDMAYDWLTDRLYGVTFLRWENRDGAMLVTVDRQTGALTKLADLPRYFCALAVDADGRLLGIDRNGYLCTITPEGNVAQIGHTGFWPGDRDQTAFYDTRTARLFWVHYAFASEEDRRWNRNSLTQLVEVDTDTGAATVLRQMQNGVGMSALGLIDAHPRAPDYATDLRWSSAPEAGKALLTFNAPTLTYAQRPLTGTLTADIVIDGQQPHTATLQPGEPYAQSFAVTEGSLTATVTFSAEGKQGLPLTAQYYFGTEHPAAVTGLTVTPAADRSSATITWEPARSAENNLPLPEGVTYTVYRQAPYEELAKIADHLTETSYTDPVAAPMAMMRYAVVASNAAGEGAPAYSTPTLLGQPLALPYEETFPNELAMLNYTTIDADANAYDEESSKLYFWYYDYEYGAPFYYGTAYETADDWLITPALDLPAGPMYRLTFDAGGYGNNTLRLQVLLGPTPTAMPDECLVADLTFTAPVGMPRHYTVDLVPRPGDRYIAFHNITTEAEHLYIDNISVVQASPATAPAAVQGLTATPAAEPWNSVTLAWTMPVAALSGDPLHGTLTAHIARSDMPTATLTGTPGQTLSWTDTDARQGTNLYSVAVANTAGETGPATTARAYAGDVTPLAPRNVMATYDDDGSVSIRWEAPDDASPRTRYTIERQTSLGPITLLDDEVDALRYVDPTPAADLLDSAPQGYVRYLVTAVNLAGPGPAMPCPNILVGTPYTLPFAETFYQGMHDNAPWRSDGTIYGASHGTGYDPFTLGQDGEGLLSFQVDYYTEFGTARFLSPLITLQGYEAAQLTFHLYGHPAYAPTTAVSVLMLADGIEVERSPTWLPAQLDGWQQLSVDLTPLAGQQRAQIAFRADIHEHNNSVHLDNISITGTPAAITPPEATHATTRWYTLHGIPVPYPTPGALYIAITGTHARKVAL